MEERIAEVMKAAEGLLKLMLFNRFINISQKNYIEKNLSLFSKKQ